MPKFTTEMELPLNDIISQLGAPSIFNPSKADFSRFAKGEAGYIYEVDAVFENGTVSYGFEVKK